ncbi:MAG: glycerophosphodiester phosphodiesterase [Burkholderiales bacterium]|nr:glycerophosphodiester phosphodiesterase [Burkholderiales bacterium]
MTAAWPLPRWIAHRGAGLLAPENTLAAFREGARHGYRAFECDVKLSGDDVAFLLHDAHLERTTNGQGRAADLPWSALSQLDAGGWHGAAFAGEPPATLAAIATWLQRNDYDLDLEIKPTPGDEERTGRLVAAEVALRWAGRPRVPLLSSFRPEALAGARATAPELPRALLVDTHWPGWWEVALRLDCVAVITNFLLMDAALCERLHAAGLRALCYTVNEPDEAQRLLACGVDGLITDAVDRFDANGA